MLPFPYAHWYVAAFLVTTIAAFMPSYFAVLPDAPWVHHLHGGTATLWIILVMTQSWTAHRRLWRAHIWSGIASMALIPIFCVGGLLATQNTLLRTSAFVDMFGRALSPVDLMLSVVVVAFYSLALRHRRSPDLHARYMLATVIIISGPALSRFFVHYVPGFLVRSLETLPNFANALYASLLMAIGLCLALIIQDQRQDRPLAPFTAALVTTLMMFVGFHLIGNSQFYAVVAEWYAAQSLLHIAVFGVCGSALAIWWAWGHPVQGPAHGHGPLHIARPVTPFRPSGTQV